PAALREVLREGAPFEQLERDPSAVVARAGAERTDHVRMSDAEPPFLLEATLQLGRSPRIAAEHLQGDVPFRPGGAVDDTHPPFAEQALDAIAADLLRQLPEVALEAHSRDDAWSLVRARAARKNERRAASPALLRGAPTGAAYREPPVRIELTTYGLRNRCSTAELRWRPRGSEELAQGRVPVKAAMLHPR